MAKELAVRAGKELLTRVSGALGVVAGLVSVAELIPGENKLFMVMGMYMIVRCFNIVEKKLFGESETTGGTVTYPTRTT